MGVKIPKNHFISIIFPVVVCIRLNSVIFSLNTLYIFICFDVTNFPNESWRRIEMKNKYRKFIPLHNWNLLAPYASGNYMQITLKVDLPFVNVELVLLPSPRKTSIFSKFWRQIMNFRIRGLIFLSFDVITSYLRFTYSINDFSI